MKFCKVALVMALSALHTSGASAFIPVGQAMAKAPSIALSFSNSASPCTRPQTSHPTRLYMESDFASAMPEAPQLTKREFLEQAADKTIASMQGALSDGVEAVPALEELKTIRNDSSSSDEELSSAIYILMIERGMTYDEDPENGILTPTNFDIKANLEEPAVKKEFSFLYGYGMQLISRGFVSMDKIKEIVTERLISRTGLTPEEFDAWLGY